MGISDDGAFLASPATDFLGGCHTRFQNESWRSSWAKSGCYHHCRHHHHHHHHHHHRQRCRHSRILSMTVQTDSNSGASSRARAKSIQVEDGGVIKVHVYGPTDNDRSSTRDVLLIHDFMTDKRLFRRFAKEPIFSGCRFIAPDLRGFGMSSAPKKPYSRSDDLSSVIRGICSETGGGAVDVIGSGMGGAVALQMGLEKQDLVRSITVLGSGMPGHSWSSDSLMLDISTSRLAGRLLDGMTERQKQNNSISAAVSEDATDLVKWKRDFIGANKATWGAILREGKKSIVKELLTMAKDYRGFHFFYNDPVIPEPFNGNPLINRLPELTHPVQILVGDLDSTDFRQIAYEIWERVPDRRENGLLRIEQAGHFLTLEQPKVVASHVFNFWQEHSPIS